MSSYPHTEISVFRFVHFQYDEKCGYFIFVICTFFFFFNSVLTPSVVTHCFMFIGFLNKAIIQFFHHSKFVTVTKRAIGISVNGNFQGTF